MPSALRCKQRIDACVNELRTAPGRECPLHRHREQSACGEAAQEPRSGAENVAQGASPGAAGTPHESAAERRKKNVHSKTYRGFVRNAMLLQKLEILLGECLPAMMLFLLRDVRAHALCA